MLTPASGLCSPENAEKRRAAAAAGKPGVCGDRYQNGRIQVGDRPLSVFASGLSDVPDIGRGVIDRTGLTGNWDLDLTFTPDRLPQKLPGQEPLAIDPNGPSLFTALQEQLGLKLESIRGPMEVLVVDRVERRQGGLITNSTSITRLLDIDQCELITPHSIHFRNLLALLKSSRSDGFRKLTVRG